MFILPTDESTQDVDDLVELANAYHASLNIERGSSFAGQHRVWALRDLQQALGSLQPDEIVVIGGHGLAGRFQFSYTASVNRVHKRGFTDPRHDEPGLYSLFRNAVVHHQGNGRALRFGGIVMQSCYSALAESSAGRPNPQRSDMREWGGRDGADDPRENFSCFPSLVRAVSKALADCGLPGVLVKGYRGPAVSWVPLGRTRVVRPSCASRFADIWNEESVKPSHDPAAARARTVAGASGNPVEKGREITAILGPAIVETVRRADAERLLFPPGSGACLETSISHHLDTQVRRPAAGIAH